SRPSQADPTWRGKSRSAGDNRRLNLVRKTASWLQTNRTTDFLAGLSRNHQTSQQELTEETERKTQFLRFLCCLLFLAVWRIPRNLRATRGNRVIVDTNELKRFHLYLCHRCYLWFRSQRSHFGEILACLFSRVKEICD